MRKESPRIAFVDLLFHWPPLGGSWVDVKEVAYSLKKLGWDVKVFAPIFKEFFPRGSIKTPTPFDVELLEFNRLSFNLFNVTKKFGKAVDAFSPDIVFVTDGYFLKPYLVEELKKKYPVFLRFYAYEILCPINNFTRWSSTVFCENDFLKNSKECLSCFGRNKRYLKDGFRFIFGGGDKTRLHFFQEFVFSLGFSSGYKKTIKSALNNSDGVIVYNNFFKDILGEHTQNIHVMPSGVDTSTFKPRKREKRLYTPASKPIINISMVGRVNDPVKGFHILDRAVRLLSLNRDDFLLAITNESPMPVHESYIRPTGWLSPSALPRLYANTDIAVIPSIWHEPFGIGAVEAMACGIPVIASRVGGLQEIVQDGVTGFIVEPRDVEGLARKLEILMDSPELREKMGENGRKRVVETYSWDKIVKDRYVPLFSTYLG